MNLGHAGGRPRSVAIAAVALTSLLVPAPARANHGIQINDVTEVESALEAVFIVTIPTSASPTTVFFTMTADTAIAGQDYVDAQGTFEIPAGDSTAVLPVELLDDDDMEADSERFFVNVSTASGPVHDGQGQATLLDDDILVDSTADPGSGSCDAAECTLREAIAFSNGGSRTPIQTIRFDLPGAPSTVTPATLLPRITRSAVIDGTTDPDFSAGDPPVVEVNGQSAGGDGFIIDADDTAIRGLVINRFAGSGIHVNGDRAQILGNFIGTDTGGTVDLGNGTGIMLEELANGAVIGGPSPAERNLISGNTLAGILITAPATGPGIGGHAIQGNWIGVMSTGAADLGNSGPGIKIEDNGFNTIGGASAGEGNVISANDGAGILATRGANNNVVRGNLIGTDADGAFAIGNAGDGIRLETFGDTIGGTTAGARNVVSGNGGSGVVVTGGFAVIQGNRIGTDLAGTGDVGNAGDGIRMFDLNQVGGTAPGAGNRIWFNDGNGIVAITFNLIRRNSIDRNGLLGIDLGGNGVSANDPGDATDPELNYPVLTSAVVGTSGTTVRGALGSRAGEAFTIDLASIPTCDPSGHGEGAAYLGETAVTTNAGGTASFAATVPTRVGVGQSITATTFDASPVVGPGDTGEFARCIRVPSIGAAGVAFTPSTASASLGSRMTWNFFGQSPLAPGTTRHTVTDSSGLALFDSGQKLPGTTFDQLFTAAATYPYRCMVHSTMRGMIQVPMGAKPLRGGTTTRFAISWATVNASSGRAYDVEIRRPGSTSFVAWQTGVTGRSIAFVPDAGPGSYAFRARMSSSAAATDWSPPTSITVT